MTSWYNSWIQTRVKVISGLWFNIISCFCPLYLIVIFDAADCFRVPLLSTIYRTIICNLNYHDNNNARIKSFSSGARPCFIPSRIKLYDSTVDGKYYDEQAANFTVFKLRNKVSKLQPGSFAQIYRRQKWNHSGQNANLSGQVLCQYIREWKAINMLETKTVMIMNLRVNELLILSEAPTND